MEHNGKVAELADAATSWKYLACRRGRPALQVLTDHPRTRVYQPWVCAGEQVAKNINNGEGRLPAVL